MPIVYEMRSSKNELGSDFFFDHPFSHNYLFLVKKPAFCWFYSSKLVHKLPHQKMTLILIFGKKFLEIYYWPKIFSRFFWSIFYKKKFFMSIGNAIFLSCKIVRFGLFYCFFSYFLTFWLYIMVWNGLILGCYDFLIHGGQVGSPLSLATHWK